METENQWTFHRSLIGPEMVILDRCPTIESILESCTDAQGRLIEEEKTLQGRILWEVYRNIIANYGVFIMLITLISYFGYRAFDVRSSG